MLKARKKLVKPASAGCRTACSVVQVPQSDWCPTLEQRCGFSTSVPSKTAQGDKKKAEMFTVFDHVLMRKSPRRSVILGVF